jgi:hypothetical protein
MEQTTILSIDKTTSRRNIWIAVTLFIISFSLVIFSSFGFDFDKLILNSNNLYTFFSSHLVYFIINSGIVFGALFFSLKICKIEGQVFDKTLLISSIYIILNALVSLITSIVLIGNLGESALFYTKFGIFGLFIYAIIITLIIKNIYKLSFRVAGSVAVRLVLIVFIINLLISFTGYWNLF